MQLHAHPARYVFDVIIALLRTPHLYLPISAALAGIVGRWVRKLRRRTKLQSVHNWTTLSAVIDVVSVADRYVGEKSHIYAGQLTYFYRNPELQMGDYERDFTSKSEAKQWVQQFKGRSVMVHVNPAAPTDSVLLDKDLAGLDLPLPNTVQVLARTSTSTDAEMLAESHQALSPSYRLLCGLGEIISIAGLATSAVLLAVCAVMHGHLHPAAFYWFGGTLLFCTLGTSIAIWLQLQRTDSGRWLLHHYSRWYPAWMGWSIKLSGAVLASVVPLLHILHAELSPILHPWIEALAPYAPYLFGGWFFMVTGAFQAAVLRSQEDPRLTVVGI
jgi:hypothetical protein